MTIAMTPRERLAALHELKAQVQRQIDDLTVRIDVASRPTRKPRTGERRPRNERPSCGTEAGYQWHRYRKDFSCEECRVAHATHERARAALRRQEAVA